VTIAHIAWFGRSLKMFQVGTLAVEQFRWLDEKKTGN
jgi:hypothetical protein